MRHMVKRRETLESRDVSVCDTLVIDVRRDTLESRDVIHSSQECRVRSYTVH